MTPAEVTDEDVEYVENAVGEYRDSETIYAYKMRVVAACFRLAESRRWVSVKERLPAIAVDVLCRVTGPTATWFVVSQISRDVNGWFEYMVKHPFTKITHWQPIHPPTGEAR